MRIAEVVRPYGGGDRLGAGGGEVPEWWAERNNKQAERLLKLFDAAKPISKLASGVPHLGGGGDHPKPQGPFVHILFQPFVWPQDSETHLANDADTLLDESKFHEDNAMDARQAANGVFDGGSWEGKGADAARTAYNEAASIKFKQAEVSRVASGLFKRASSDVGMTKRLMGKESDAAHKEAEAFLRSSSGQSLAQVAVILGVHRTAIQGYSSDLQGFATQYTTQFTNHFKESPGGGPKVKQAGDDTTDKDPRPTRPQGRQLQVLPVRPTAAEQFVTHRRAALAAQPRLHQADLYDAPSTDQPFEPPRPSHNPLTSLMGGGLPGLPSMPGGGSGGGIPMGPVAGADGWFRGFPRGDGPAGWVGCVWVAGVSDAVVGDGFRARLGGGCFGGWCCSACDTGSDDVVGGAGGDGSDVGGAGGCSGGCCAPGWLLRRRHLRRGVSGGWFDAVWFGASSAGHVGGAAGWFGAGGAVGSC